MKHSLTGLLVCPRCRGRMTLAATLEESAEVVSGSLKCDLGHSFPVVRGVPRFVDSERHARNFGFEWNRHNRTQLDTRISTESEDSFRTKTGFTPEELRGKLVLDVGCGMGRFSDIASRWGAIVVGIDLSSAVEAAQVNVGSLPNVDIIQADVLELPFADETFDYIFSIGVLHHTPDTKAAFDQLPRLLKPGGKVAIWLYSRYDGMRWRFSDLWRRWTWRIPERVLHGACYAAVPLHYLYKLPVLGYFGKWLLPVSDHPKAEWRILDTFDWYSPRYQWKHTYEETWLWFEAQGLIDIRVLGMPVAIQGKRPGRVGD